MSPTKRDSRITKIANCIKELRIEAGYTSAEKFAYDHDIPRIQYWRSETGANLTLTSLLRILDIHKVSLEEFSKKAGV